MCGPATLPITRASTPKWPSASTSWAAIFSCPAVSGRAASSEERFERAGVRHRPLEVGRVGDRRPVAALRREIGRRAGHARLVGLRVLGEARGLLHLGLGSEASGSWGSNGSGSSPSHTTVSAGGVPRETRGSASLQRGQLLGRAPPLDRRPHARLRLGERVGRRLHHARDRGAGQQQHGGQEQEQRHDVGADHSERGRDPPVQPLPHQPAARAHPVGVPAHRLAARAEPERARRQAERQAPGTGRARRTGTAARPAASRAGPGSRRPRAAPPARPDTPRRSAAAARPPPSRRPRRRPTPGRSGTRRTPPRRPSRARSGRGGAARAGAAAAVPRATNVGLEACASSGRACGRHPFDARPAPPADLNDP